MENIWKIGFLGLLVVAIAGLVMAVLDAPAADVVGQGEVEDAGLCTGGCGLGTCDSSCGCGCQKVAETCSGSCGLSECGGSCQRSTGCGCRS